MAERDEIQDFADRLRKVATGGALAKALRIGSARVALMIQREAALNATTSPHVRSGRLRRSIIGRVEDVEGSRLAIVIRAGGGKADVRYAAAQEYGATIRPKKAKFLAIPLDAAKTKAGVSRYKSPRDAGDLSAIPISRGRFLLVRKAKPRPKGGKRKRAAPPKRQPALFLLTREPTVIRPTRFLARAIESTGGRLSQEIGDVVVVEVDRGV